VLSGGRQTRRDALTPVDRVRVDRVEQRPVEVCGPCMSPCCARVTANDPNRHSVREGRQRIVGDRSTDEHRFTRAARGHRDDGVERLPTASPGTFRRPVVGFRAL